jgi:hypothetical protein
MSAGLGCGFRRTWISLLLASITAMVQLLDVQARSAGRLSEIGPRAANPGTSVVFIHGFMGSSGYGADTMPDYDAYWSDTFSYVKSRWPGDLRQVSFHRHDCAGNGTEKGRSACLLDWYLYENFGRHGWEAVIVTHRSSL